MNGRIYDPLLGRFLSADVLVQNPANLQCYNRYSYVMNNPLTLTDPSGFIAGVDDVAIGAFFVASMAIAYVESPQGQQQIKTTSDAIVTGVTKAADAVKTFVGGVADRIHGQAPQAPAAGEQGHIQNTVTQPNANLPNATTTPAATPLPNSTSTPAATPLPNSTSTPEAAPLPNSTTTPAATPLPNSTTTPAPNAAAPTRDTASGIYEFPDKTAGNKPYVGQSGNTDRRLGQHEAAGRLVSGTETVTPVAGGKTQREVAEHTRIQELTGGVPARKSDDVANKVDPIGPNRQHLLEPNK